MSPYELARQVYGSERCVRSFEEDLEAHLVTGFVFSTPDFFIMGRPVDRQADPALIVDPCVAFARERCDCWHLYLFAGDMEKAWIIEPWALPWFSFERKNELRFVPSRSIRRLSAARQPAAGTPTCAIPASPVTSAC